MATSDPFDLERFVQAQAPIYSQALEELRAGAKRSHWMWFIFPQIAGLGLSSTSRRFAIRNGDEAAAYWAHLVLGPRLRECSEAVLDHRDKSAREILGSPDDLKLRSSATLFSVVTREAVFDEILRHFFEGIRDDATVRLLGAAPNSSRA